MYGCDNSALRCKLLIFGKMIRIFTEVKLDVSFIGAVGDNIHCSWPHQRTEIHSETTSSVRHEVLFVVSFSV